MQKEITDVGKALKIRLIRENQSQKSFIEYLRGRLPDMYIDSSILHKIIVGEVNSGRVFDEVSKYISAEDSK
jgi:hypothetical protein|nr:MAG TPA: hypothetical protein [Caudoviricetes sp.]